MEKINSKVNYLAENASEVFIMSGGQIKTYPKPLFWSGDVAIRHKNEFVILDLVDYVEKRGGWVYGITYIDKFGKGGSGSACYEEKEFQKPETMDDILLAKRIVLIRQIKSIESDLMELKKELKTVKSCLIYKYQLPDE